MTSKAINTEPSVPESKLRETTTAGRVLPPASRDHGINLTVRAVSLAIPQLLDNHECNTGGYNGIC